MAKGPYITEKTRILIADILLRNPKLVAKEVHAQVEKIMGNSSPGISAVQKEITKLKKRRVELPPSGMDKPWSIGCLKKYNFSPGIIPVLIEEQRHRMENTNEILRQRLTIREAQCMDRLYPLVMEYYLKNYTEELDALNKRPIHKTYLWILSAIAGMYAHFERIAEILGTDYLDTIDLDIEYFVVGRFWDLPDSEKANSTKKISDHIVWESALKEWSRSRTSKPRTEDVHQSTKSQ